MKLSICIPTWNRSEFLGRSLPPILEQIIANDLVNHLEICVSDNGSTDSTQEQIDAICSRYPTVRVNRHRFPTNQGFARNLDAAIRIATGEFLFLTGDDDIFVANGIATLFEHACTIAHEVVFIRNYQDHDGTLTCDTILPGQAITFPSLLDALLALGRLYPTFIGNFIFSREAYLIHFHPRFLDSIYPHTAVLFEILKNKTVDFVDFKCIEVDVNNRRLGMCAARGISVDVARIQTEGGIFRNVGGLLVLKMYWMLLRSIPRAILSERAGHCPRVNNPYTSTGITNLLSAYRASWPAMACATALALSSRLCPQWLLIALLK